MTQQPSPEPKTIEDRFREEVLDAIELLEFAVETGRNVDDAIVDRMKKAQSYFKTTDQAPTDADRAEFEKTYRDLAKAMSPVNIQTLRATADGRPGVARGRLSRVVFPRSSDAKVFSKQLWVWVVLCALAIVFTGVISQIYVPDEESASSGMSWFIAFAKPLLPFVHGLLGALTYLMRSAHNYIAERSFDLQRTPEYYNRMLLGFVSGGVVLLFVDPKSFNVSDGAVAFIVGYNTDYLFAALERVAGAVFPKAVGTGSSQASAGTGKLSISKITVSNGELQPGGQGTGTISLTGPAPSDGLLVALSSDGTITIPKTVTVPAGTNSAQFAYSVPATSAEGAVSITATASGSSASASIRIRPALAVQSVSAQKGPDSTVSGTVELNGIAITEDIKVTIESDQAWCRIAATTLSVAKGTKQAAFSATLDAAATGTVTFTARLGQSQAKGSLTV
jgi:hypothetical protein